MRVRDRRRVGGQPAGRVQQRDQVRADHAVHRVGEAQAQLLAEMVAQGAGARRRSRRCRARRRRSCDCRRGPRSDRQRGRRRRRRRDRRSSAWSAIERRRRLGRQRVGARRIGRIGRRVGARARSGRARRARRSAVRRVSSRSSSGLRSSSSSTNGVDLDIGVLQQLDRLTQLRRHDQRLALAKSRRGPIAMYRD